MIQIMKDLIKKYIGIVGFIVALIGVLISAYYKFYHNNELDSVGEFSLLLLISTMTISNELNKSNPKQWYIYLVTVVLIFFFIYIIYWIIPFKIVTIAFSPKDFLKIHL